MAKFHVLSGNNNLYQVAIHVATPAGNNSAGIAWSTCLVNSGMNKTRMTEGNGAGQITTAEKNQVLAGAVIEISYTWGDDPNWTSQQRIDDINTRVDQATTERLAQLADQLKYYGYTQA